MLRCVSADFPVRRTRHLRFIELWEPRNWMLKIYFHSAHPDQLSREFLAKAKIFIEPQLVEAEQTKPLHRVGFMILSHGAVSNWVLRGLSLIQRISSNLNGLCLRHVLSNANRPGAHCVARNDRPARPCH